MEDFNKKATKEIADMMHYVAEDVVDNAGYDKTRNATITKVYYAQDLNTIIGYDVKVDGRSYNIPKESGRGIIAKKNDVVKLHFPCNNTSQFYLSYPHDPEDFIIRIEYINYPNKYIIYYNSGRICFNDTSYYFDIQFPIKTEQFSSQMVAIQTHLPPSQKYTFNVYGDNGVWGVVTNSDVTELDGAINVKVYNDNPDKINPVEKSFMLTVEAHGQLIQSL